MCHTNYFFKKQPHKTKPHIFRNQTYLQAKNIASKSYFSRETMLILSYSEHRDHVEMQGGTKWHIDQSQALLQYTFYFIYFHTAPIIFLCNYPFKAFKSLLTWPGLGLTMRYKNMGYVLLPLWSLEIRESQQGKKCVLKPVNTPWKKQLGKRRERILLKR